MSENPLALLPELALLGGALGGLLLGMVMPRRRQWTVAAVAGAACLLGLVAAAVALAGSPSMAFESYAIDTVTGFGRLVVLGGTLLTIVLSIEPMRGHPRESEYYVLLLLGAMGAVLLSGAADLLLLAAAYLLASVPLYALVGFTKEAAATEGALKYYLVGAFFGVLLLTGVTVMFGLAGATDYAGLRGAAGGMPAGAATVGLLAVLAGLLFKVGAVPGHFWVPDAAEGATPSVAAFVTTIPKIGGFLALLRLFVQGVPDLPVDWPLLLALVATASMTLGNLAAFFQDSPRRLLGYSTVGQVGYLLLPVVVAARSNLAQPSLLLYLAGYAVTNLGAFAVVVELPGRRTLADYRGLFRERPGLTLTLVVCLLGLVGTPPTVVFVGKLAVFGAAIDGRFTWLAVVAVLNTVASLFYYLRWILPAFTGTAPAVAQPATGWATRAGAYTAAVASVVLGLASGAVLALARGPLAG
ncbi:MAG: NADH-quinone oxidoreductase subunit N [Actinomycetota bacterium]